MKNVEPGVYEIYQPMEKSLTGNHIHVIGEVMYDTVIKIHYVYPDDKFIETRENKYSSFFIDEKFLKRKIEGEELLKWLI